MVSASSLFNPDSKPVNDLIAELEKMKADNLSDGATIEFGDNSELTLDIATIINNFMDKVFDMAISSESISEYAEVNDLTLEEAEEQMKLTKYIKMKTIPDASGERPDSGQLKEDGGIANILEMFIKLLCKIIGYACETFISILDPLKALIQQYIYNIDDNPLNPSPLGDIIYFELMAIATASVPATAAAWVAKKVAEIKKMIDHVKTLINDVIIKITKMISDIQGFIVDQMLEIQKFIDETISEFNGAISKVGDNAESLIAEKKQDFQDYKDKREDKARERKEARMEKASKRKEKRDKKKKNKKGKKTLPFEKLSFMVPPIPLGFAGVEIPGFDMTGRFDEADNPVSAEWLALAGVVSLDLVNLIFNPVEEISNMGFDVSDIEGFERGNVDIDKLDTTELDFFARIFEDPILQLEYINALNEYNYIDDFYSQPRVPIKNSTEYEFSNTFDFFKEFPLRDTADDSVIYVSDDELINPENYINKQETYVTVERLGLISCIENAGLMDNETFILDFYKLVDSYDYSLITISDELKEVNKKNGYHFENLNGDQVRLENGKFEKRTWGIRNGINGEGIGYSFYGWIWTTLETQDEIFGLTSENRTTLDTFTKMLEFSYLLNYWNPVTVDKTSTVYSIGDTDKINYKDFKLKFWNNIPKDKLKYFSTHLETYTLYYQDYSEHKDLLTQDFTQVLRYSNDQSELVNGVLEIYINGALSDNEFRDAVGLGPKFSKLFSDDMYNGKTGLVDIKIPSFSDILDVMKDNLPAAISLIFTNVDFIANLIIMPINMMFSVIEEVLSIVISCVSIDIPGAFQKLLGFVKTLKPDIDLFKDLAGSILDPLIESFIGAFVKQVAGIFSKMDNTGNIFDGVGGDFVDNVAEKVGDTAEKVGDKVGESAEAIKDKAKVATDKVNAASEKVSNKANEVVDKANEKIGKVTDNIDKYTEMSEELVKTYVDPMMSVLNLIMSDAIPELLFDTIKQIFNAVLSSITERIPKFLVPIELNL